MQSLYEDLLRIQGCGYIVRLMQEDAQRLVDESDLDNLR